MLTPRNPRSVRVFVLLVAILATPALVSLPAAGVDAAPARSASPVPPVYAATSAASPSLLQLDGRTLTQHTAAAVDYGDVVVLGPDGRTAYVAEGSDLAIADTGSRAVARVRNVAPARGFLYDVVVSPDGRRVYTSDFEQVAVIDPAKRTVVKRIAVPGADRLLVSPDGAKIYAVSGHPNADAITVIDPATASAKPFSLAQQGDSSTIVEDAALAPDGHAVIWTL